MEQNCGTWVDQMSHNFAPISETRYAIIYEDIKHFYPLVQSQSIFNLNDLRWISAILEFFRSSKNDCPTFLIQFKCDVERHVTHSWKKIITVHSNHLFCSKTRLHFRSFLAKVSRAVSTSKLYVPKTSLLTGRGTPPPFQKIRNPTVVEDRHFTWWPLYLFWFKSTRTA